MRTPPFSLVLELPLSSVIVQGEREREREREREKFVRQNSSSHVELRQAVTPPEPGNPDRPAQESCGADARAGKVKVGESNVERSELAESRHGQDVDQMLKKFRRQDRVTNSIFVGVFFALFATFAVWSWLYDL
jgi:hypothetical protein